MQSRREALKIIGAVGVTCAFPFSANELYGQHVHDHAETQPAAPKTAQFFTTAQLLVISRLTDLIIPPTDTPGAAAAGVPAYIDLVVKENPELQATFKEGLLRLDAVSESRFANTSFLELAEAEQVEILTSLSQAAGKDGDFFRAIKNLTADGYYTSRIGLLQELGYNGDAVLAAFPAFTIPEH